MPANWSGCPSDPWSTLQDPWSTLQDQLSYRIVGFGYDSDMQQAVNWKSVTVQNKTGRAAEDFDLVTIALLSATQLGDVAQGEAISFTVRQFVRYQAVLWP